MHPADVVRDYYEALRRGEPLYPYFAERETTTKFGVRDSLSGYDAVAEALREQTRTTDDWTVESHDLTVDRADDSAWFADRVDLAWTDTAADTRRSYDTRWSGTLRELGEEWQFVGMHVSAPHEW